MKGTFKYSVVSLFMIMLILLSCGRKEDAEIIPRGKLARIYAEMLLTDQWITTTPDMRKIADTTLVYEPILMRYGYDSEDYMYTVRVYLDDPERFSRIWRTTSQILEKRKAELTELSDRLEEDKKRSRITTDFDASVLFPYLYDEPYIHYYDSLAVEMDSVAKAYRIRTVEVSDTLYDRIRMIVRIDSTSVPESDTLSVADVSDSARVKIGNVRNTVRQLKESRNLPLRQLEIPER